VTEWSKSLVEWTNGSAAYLSVVFTWDLPKAYMRAVWLRQQGYEVKAGGPACLLMPDYLAEVADVNGCAADALWRHNPDATFTSRGCIRKCAFCAVPKIEGDLVELDEWEPKPIVCDNNLLACSKKHFDKAIDSLKGVEGVDFNQGLDARLLTDYHAERLAELDLVRVRLSWDRTNLEREVFSAAERVHWAGVPRTKITIFCLIGFWDSPSDALYRLRTVRGQGYVPFPMRYQPLSLLERNGYVAPGWSNRELNRYMKYWSRLRFTRAIPFEEFGLGGSAPVKSQATLELMGTRQA